MISYEWTAEYVDIHGDIIDSDFADKLNDLDVQRLIGGAVRIDVALIVREGNNVDGERWREYAYVKSGTLPEMFPGGRKMPRRFHDELGEFLSFSTNKWLKEV